MELGATDRFAADTPDLVDLIRATTGRGVNFSFNTTTSPVFRERPRLPGDARGGRLRDRAARRLVASHVQDARGRAECAASWVGMPPRGSCFRG